MSFSEFDSSRLYLLLAQYSDSVSHIVEGQLWVEAVRPVLHLLHHFVQVRVFMSGP